MLKAKDKDFSFNKKELPIEALKTSLPKTIWF
jgi:hypothetical protein